MASAEFDYSAWVSRYPEFEGAVDQGRAALFFAEAGLYLDNSDCSPVTNLTTRLMLLNMIVAHLAVLSGALEPDGKPTGMVGRVSTASEGSVSISVDTGLMPGSAPWFQQTSYGLSFWQATKNLRTARYVPSSGYVSEPWASPWRR